MFVLCNTIPLQNMYREQLVLTIWLTKCIIVNRSRQELGGHCTVFTFYLFCFYHVFTTAIVLLHASFINTTMGINKLNAVYMYLCNIAEPYNRKSDLFFTFVHFHQVYYSNLC